jgi:protein disulfide-isomerase-like protein
MKYILLITFIISTHATVYLKTDTFESETQGKKAFVVFKAPWCGHCKKLKPDWDNLADNVNVLIGEVDCTVEKDLCEEQGVKGYPTIKYSDGYGWKKYEKGREYDTLENFVNEELQDGCFDDINLCSEEELQNIENTKSLTIDELQKKKEELKENREDLEGLFKLKVDKLQKKYEELTNEKNTKLDTIARDEGYLNFVIASNEDL